MNNDERAEFEKLKEQQQKLQLQLDQLSSHIVQLENRLTVSPTAEPVAEIKPMEIPPFEVAPLEDIPTIEKKAAPSHPPIPVPPVIAETAQAPKVEASQKVETEIPKEQTPPLTVPPPLPPEAFTKTPASEPPPFVFNQQATTEPPSAEPPKKDSSFEMRLGTYWLVRIGIVVLLTGLAFLGSYAYEHFIVKMGPAGKLSLLYIASGLLLGFGAWLQRKDQKESLKNYAKVLFAGGLAGVYFSTYAAYYLPAVKVIQNAALDGVLLLLWAGFIAWLADRKKSETLALFATGLAYYSSIITSIGLFTLYSNLILTIASVFFLVRNRWTKLSFGSLIATYAGFAFWRFYNQGLDWDLRRAEIWNGNIFLGGYWIVFTTAVFLSRSEKLAGAARATFASLNNAGFFSLVILSMLHIDHGNFWKFSLGFGTTLVVLSILAKRFLAAETAIHNTYLTQGVLLITVGFIAHYSGLRLALILAAESAALLVLSIQQKNAFLRAGAYITGILATGWQFTEFTRHGLNASAINANEALLGTAVGAFFFFNAFWSRRRSAAGEEKLVLAEAIYFSVLALFNWFLTTWRYVSPEWLAPALAIETAVLTASLYVHRIREATLLAQGYLLIAQLLWIVRALWPRVDDPWWTAAIIISITLCLSHWWQRQKALDSSSAVKNVFQCVYALALIGVLFFWLEPLFQPAHWLAFTSLLAVGITAYGIVTRAWFLAGAGQIFLLVSIGEFIIQLLRDEPDWFFALAPIATLLIMAFGVAAWLMRKENTEDDGLQSIVSMSLLYRWVATAMTLWWVMEYIPKREQVWVLTLIGTGIFLAGGWLSSTNSLLFSAVFFAAGFIQFAVNPETYWANLLAILVLPALQQIAKRQPARFSIEPKFHGILIVPAILCLWLYVSQWVLPAQPLYLTLVWSALAVLILGGEFGLQERTYRWMSFVILTAALGRVVLVDVWRPAIFWPNILPILLVLGLQQLTKRFPTRYALQSGWLNLMILAGGGSLWLFISRWAIMEAGGHRFFLTASWAGLALIIFSAGFVLRERTYRWLGLGILGCALGRIIISDVWKLETIHRILSFMALGIVLLVLGFLYNKYQERIKQWL